MPLFRKLALLMKQRENQMASYAGYGSSVLVVFVIALLSVPIVLFVFRTTVPASGCALTVLYLFVIWLIPIVIATIAFGASGGRPEFLLYGGILLLLSAGGFAVPLMVTRETGFELTSPTRFAREQRHG